MPSDRWSPVADYVTLRRGVTYSGELVGKPGPVLLGLGSIEPGGGFRSRYKTFGGECPPSVMVEAGGIYVALKGATKDATMIGSVARLPRDIHSGRLTQDTARLDFRDPDPAVASHLYWALRTPQYRQYCAGRLIGSAAASLSREDFLSFRIPPTTPVNRALVQLLDAIEGKMELNRRIAHRVEAAARALFRAWFIEFQPVRAKAAARKPGVPGSIAGHFPDSFEESEMGPIPAGWGATTLADFARLNPESWVRGNRPSTIAYVDLSGTKWGRIETVAMHSAAGAPSRAQRVLRPGDTIVGTVRPGNGSFALVRADGLTGSTGFAVLRPREVNNTEFVYLTATDRDNIDALAHLADGAAYPAIRPEVVLATGTVKAPAQLIAHFSAVTRPMLKRIGVAEAESATLAEVRDALLPTLFSGGLRVPDPQRVLEAASV